MRYSDTGITDPPLPDPTITASAGNGIGGSISPAGTQTITRGTDSALYTITPRVGYVISDVLVDGTSIGAVSSYQFTNVQTSHTIVATFRTPSAGDMPVQGECDTCHAEHGEPPPCSDCHAFQYQHPGTPTSLHLPANVVDCSPCHVSSLTEEHNGRTTSTGAAVTCGTCHSSTDPLVTSAIATRNSACTACHPTAGHAGVHGSGIANTPLGTTGQVCGDCHQIELTVEHAKATASSAAAECTNCHPTPRDTITAWSGGCVQDGCHAAGSGSEMHGAQSTAHDASALAPDCSPCHQIGDVSAIHSNSITTNAAVTTCATCHVDNATLPTTIDCLTSCHTDKTPTNHGSASAHAFTTGSDANASGDAGCTNSGSGCHGTETTYANFTNYHPASGCTAGACHTSASKPGYAGNGDCQSCHDGTYTGAPARATLASEHYVTSLHAVTPSSMAIQISARGTVSAVCSDCHDGAGGLAAQHTNVPTVAGSTYGSTVSCVECHSDTRAGGNAAVLANWPTKSCAACHSLSSSAIMHDTEFAPAVAGTAGDYQGLSCDDAACHATNDLHELHKGSAGGVVTTCALSGCHDFGGQAVKPTAKSCGATGDVPHDLAALRRGRGPHHDRVKRVRRVPRVG